MKYCVFIIWTTFALAANSQIKNPNVHWGSSELFYIVDTIKVESAYRLRFEELNKPGNLIAFNIMISDIDSLIRKYGGNYNEFIRNGFAIKAKGTISSYVFYSSIINKLEIDALYKNIQINNSDDYRNYEYSESTTKIEVFSSNARCFVIALVSQDLLNAEFNHDIFIEGGNLKFVRLAFPCYCEQVGIAD